MIHINYLWFQYHRSINFNSFHHQSEHSSFYRQFKGNNSIVSIANFSGLSIDNKTLESFLDEHSKTIQCLDISNCPNLFPKTLNAINNILTKVTDVKKMHRTLKIYEIINGSKRLIVDKHYHNGVCGVFGSSQNGQINLTACIEDHQFQPKNYWYNHYEGSLKIAFNKIIL